MSAARDAAYWERRRNPITALYRESGLTIADLAARYQCSYGKMRDLLIGWGADIRHKGTATEPGRNEKILELAKAGKSDKEIKAELGLKSTGVVIGVRNRNGMAPGASGRNKGEHHLRQRIVRKAREAAEPPLPDHPRKPPAQTPSQVLEDAMLAAWAPQVAPEAEPAPPAAESLPTRTIRRGSTSTVPMHPDELGSARWVTLEKRTGCAWPIHADSFCLWPRPAVEVTTYCNAPCCSVRGGNSPKPEKTAYCAAHWDSRRASGHTRIIADAPDLVAGRARGGTTYGGLPSAGASDSIACP